MPDDTVDLWCVSLDLPEDEVLRCYSVLGPDEQSLAARFKFQRDRDRFVARRTILRFLLANYSGVDPAAISLQRSTYGKLHIAPHESSRIRFSVSCSGSAAAYAIARDRDVGIDIECLDPHIDWHGIARTFFTAHEQHSIAGEPSIRQTQAFFQTWTKKESFLKAIGTGFQLDPTSIDVTSFASPGATIALQHDHRVWKLLTLSSDESTIAITAAGTDWRLRQYRLECCSGVFRSVISVLAAS